MITNSLLGRGMVQKGPFRGKIRLGWGRQWADAAKDLVAAT